MTLNIKVTPNLSDITLLQRECTYTVGTDIISHLPKTLVMPVSGQAMTAQIGILLNLVNSGYKPKLTLGASGGAMVAANAVQVGWDAEKWKKELDNICDTNVLRKHYLGYIQALQLPYLFNKGSGLESYYKLITSAHPDEYRNNEIIINAYNTSVGQTELFTTATSSCSVLSATQGPLNYLGVSGKVHFLGDLPNCEFRKTFEQILRATSAVPVVFDQVSFRGCYYADGGVSFSSPLTAVNSLVSLTDILYINPENIDKCLPTTYSNIFDNTVAFTSQITRSNALQDRYMFLLSLCCGRFERFKVINGEVLGNDSQQFDANLIKTKAHPRLVELYPIEGKSLTMLDTQSRHEHIRNITVCNNHFGYRIFYLCD